MTMNHDDYSKYIMNTFLKRLFDRCMVHSLIPWRRIFEGPRIMMSVYKKAAIIIFGRLRTEQCLAAISVARFVLRHQRRSGLLHTSMYLKQAASSLMIAYGGTFNPHTPLATSISLTRTGFPRIIPRFHRMKIRRKDDESDSLVQWYLSLFSVYRLVVLAPNKALDLSSILTPIDWEPWTPEGDGGRHRCQFVTPTLDSRLFPNVDVLRRYLNFYRDRISEVEFLPTWKSTSLSNTCKKFGTVNGTLQKGWSSVFPVLADELGQFLSFSRWINLKWGQTEDLDYPSSSVAQKGIPRSDSPFAPLGYYLGYPTPFKKFSPSGNPKEPAPSSPDLPEEDTNDKAVKFAPNRPAGVTCAIRFSMSEFPDTLPPELTLGGRLAIKVEGGGKRRLFTLGNYFVQSYLRPVHDWLMKFLASLPMDGTFNQTAPLDRLKGRSHYYCFDLKSATDRWPLFYQMLVVMGIPGINLDRFWPFIHLTYDVSRLKAAGGVTRVRFKAGQPLGLYSSWPLFTLSHHVLVWQCAELAYPGKHFTDYAILGDDIVIADSKVATLYRSALADLGVSISIQKSLISESGAAEFAKRFRVKSLTKDISPISFRDLLVAYQPFAGVALAMKYKITSFNVLARISGFGHRSIHSPRPGKRLRRLKAIYALALYEKGHYDLFLGFKSILSPYAKGYYRFRILESLKPRELVMPPQEVMSDDNQWIAEVTAYKGWLRQYLRYYLWWLDSHFQFDQDLSFLFSGPVYCKSWLRSEDDLQMKSFSIFWRIYDDVQQQGPDWAPVGILPTVPLSRLIAVPEALYWPPKPEQYLLDWFGSLDQRKDRLQVSNSLIPTDLRPEGDRCWWYNELLSLMAVFVASDYFDLCWCLVLLQLVR